MVQSQNTQEYRRRVWEAAVSLIPQLLQSAGGSLSTREIHARFKQEMPQLCDDSIKCGDDNSLGCNQNHPEWEHSVDWALQSPKIRRVVEKAGRGSWRLKGIAQAVPPPAPKPESAPPVPQPAPKPTSLRNLIVEHLLGLRDEVAQRIANLSADQFEELVATVLGRTGYSDVRRVGGPSDRNIDVIATYLAPFIRAAVRVQVKHRRSAPNIGPTDVAAFRDRAGGPDHTLLMMTNVEFTDGARETASEQGRQRVYLVDGKELINHMRNGRIGVREGPMGVLEIDEDFWSQF